MILKSNPSFARNKALIVYGIRYRKPSRLADADAIANGEHSIESGGEDAKRKSRGSNLERAFGVICGCSE
jgi:hypothetical protein